MKKRVSFILCMSVIISFCLGVIPNVEVQAKSYRVTQENKGDFVDSTFYTYDVHVSTTKLSAGTKIKFDIPDSFYNVKEKEIKDFYLRQEADLKYIENNPNIPEEIKTKTRRLLNDRPNPTSSKTYISAGWGVKTNDSVYSEIINDQFDFHQDVRIENIKKGQAAKSENGVISFDGKTVTVTIKNADSLKYDGYKGAEVYFWVDLGTNYDLADYGEYIISKHGTIRFEISPDGKVYPWFFRDPIGESTEIQSNVSFTEDVNAKAKADAKAVLDKGFAIRLYDEKSSSGDHVYTADFSEAENLINQGWTHETYANGKNSFKSSPVKTAEYSKPVYCAYNPNSGGFHLYTNKKGELNTLVSQYGWKDIYNGKPVFYVSGDSGKKGIYRAYNPNSPNGQQHYCTKGEYEGLINQGWQANNNSKPYWYTD